MFNVKIKIKKQKSLI